jgi:hypothetical protein
MNRYTYKFTSICPVNEKKISYQLIIETTQTIKVEDIMGFIEDNHKQSFHEVIADDLIDCFPGEHYLVAEHHGVLIETWRK